MLNMMNLRPAARLLALAFVVAAASGCAVGNRYDYRSAIGGLPLAGPGRIAVDVVDARPYVVNGEKGRDFVGLQRGGFGNPFDVKTGSGAPLADEMRSAINGALQRQGFTVLAAGEQAPRQLELRMLDWKTDVMARMKVSYDLTLSVRDGNGGVLATKTTKGEEVLAGGFESANATNATRAFEMRLTELISDPAVRGALTAATP
jgi:hypothetical protein